VDGRQVKLLNSVCTYMIHQFRFLLSAKPTAKIGLGKNLSKLDSP
jgi:hypothetical protein